MASKLRTPLILSGVIAGLAAASSAGPFYLDLYRHDTPLMLGTLEGSDLITLFLATPLLIWGMILTMRGSAAGILLWIGMLECMLYTFAYYLLGAEMNEFFLVYAALAALSLLAIISAMSNAWLTAIGSTFKKKTPARRISLFMFAVAAALAGLWSYDWYQITLQGADLGMPAETFRLTAGVGMAVFVPLMLVIAGMLWRRTPAGYALATSIMVMATVYPLTLIASSLFQARAGVERAWATVPLWAAIAAGSLLCCAALFRNMQKPRFSE